jgi:hypothetical protein
VSPARHDGETHANTHLHIAVGVPHLHRQRIAKHRAARRDLSVAGDGNDPEVERRLEGWRGARHGDRQCKREPFRPVQKRSFGDPVK